MDSKRKTRALLWGGIALLTVAVLYLSLSAGTRFLSPSRLFAVITGHGDPVDTQIFRYARLPRTVASFLAGAALAAAGYVLQQVLSNPLASPGIIGINAGAGLGVTLCTALGLLSGLAVSLFAFGGSLCAVLIISLFAVRTNASKTTVILGGVALNSLLGAGSECLAVLDPDVAQLTTEFRVGGFASVSHTRLWPAAVLIFLSFLVLLTLSNELDVVALGDETAESIGLPVKKYRLLFLILAALLAGAAVSFTGLLGFVGLIVPHLVRRIMGRFSGGSRRLLPLCAVLGGGFVCFADTLARLIFQPYELPVGILMALIGGPVFVILLVRMKGGHRHA